MNLKQQQLAQIQHELLILESNANNLKQQRDVLMYRARKLREQAVQLHNELGNDEQQTQLNLE